MDPRVSASGTSQEDLVAQESLALQTVSLLNKAKRNLVKLEEHYKKAKRTKEADLEKLAELKSKIDHYKTLKGRYQTPTLIDQISYLFSMLKRADQLPGADAYDRYNELSTQLNELSED